MRPRFALAALGSVVELGLHQLRSSEQIRRLQNRKLRRLVRHAYRHVPYYRAQWQQAGIDPRDVRTVEDLKDLPILERSAITSDPDGMTSRKALAGDEGPLQVVRTSGSMGTPVGIVYSVPDLARSRVLAHYGHIRSGRRLRDVMAHVCVPDRFGEGHHELERFGLARTVSIDLMEGVDRNLDSLRELQPEVIYGYPSYLTLMARTLLDGGGAEIRPRLLIVNGEVLAASTRSLLSDAFGCEVRDSYGSVEFQQIAFECREGRLHVIPSVIVEADDETAGGDGYADILVTSLYHYTMPLIRYRLGDRVRVSDDRCRCGEGFGVIEGVFGRSDDFVTLAGGRTISARAINRLDDVRGVREYQIVQKTPERFEVLVTPGDGFDQEAKADIVDIIRRGCGDEAVTVEVITTDHIPRSKSGKLRAVVSEVS